MQTALGETPPRPRTIHYLRRPPSTKAVIPTSLATGLALASTRHSLTAIQIRWAPAALQMILDPVVPDLRPPPQIIQRPEGDRTRRAGSQSPMLFRAKSHSRKLHLGTGLVLLVVQVQPHVIGCQQKRRKKGFTRQPGLRWSRYRQTSLEGTLQYVFHLISGQISCSPFISLQQQSLLHLVLLQSLLSLQQKMPRGLLRRKKSCGSFTKPRLQQQRRMASKLTPQLHRYITGATLPNTIHRILSVHPAAKYRQTVNQNLAPLQSCTPKQCQRGTTLLPINSIPIPKLRRPRKRPRPQFPNISQQSRRKRH